ncbi:PfkB family carbohydrate kinase [Actinoplanes sp. RD1]|uniref:PfkB family carbohydrate kinase n=1 Tax=Actinoplanes sp. RD1 TaxID=3064538 RepID=UPI002740B237|nr:PfkB family carbohydrate kinase [Actinoplanes sp. RD1]
MARPRIVCVGLATVDLIQRVERLPGPDEKVESLRTDTAAGGPATNAAIAAAALGADVTLVTAVGPHPLGGLIRADLAEYGVSLVDTATGGAPPPVSAVTVLDGTGERAVVSRNARGATVDVPDDRVFAGADAVLADGHHPALARAAARSGRPLVLDAGSWRPVFAELLPVAAVTACSSVFRPPGTDDAEAVPGPPGAPGARGVEAASAPPGARGVEAALRRLGVGVGAITRGPDPVRWWSGAEAGELAVPAVEAVDTAGAGDAFHGALTVAVARGAGLTDALRFAIEIATVRVQHRGPRSWLAALPAS